ncbi:MAG: YfjI family protein [Actinomycetota bacterium]|nr:YfjI family protein [Actinomycetota bacterium]
MAHKKHPAVEMVDEVRSKNGLDAVDAVDAVDADSRGSRDLPDALPFPVGALPEPCRVLVKEAAAAIGCPPEFIGVPMLVVLGSAVGNSRVVRLKRGWEEGAALFAFATAEPGEKKTPAFKVAMHPAHKKQAELQNSYAQRRKEYDQELQNFETDRKDAAKFGQNAPPAPEPPTRDRTLVENATTEALTRVLAGAPRGVVSAQDELAGWLRSMDQYRQGGKGADRQFWLSLWSNSPVVVDRKGEDEPTMLNRPFAGLFGSIQPGVLSELGQGREDGLLDRFLIAYPTPTPSRWTDDEITEGARDAYRKLYDGLRDLHMPMDDHGDPDPARVHFSPDGKIVLIDAINGHREEMEQPGFPSRLKGPWAKLEAYIARLTLILALSRSVHEGTAERAETKDVLSATLLVDYFKNHARRAYVGLYGENPDDRLAEDLAEFLKARGGRFKDEPAVLFDGLESVHKGTRPDELSKRVRVLAKRSPSPFIVSDKNIKKNGQSRRALEITLEIGVNGVNGVNPGEVRI